MLSFGRILSRIQPSFENPTETFRVNVRGIFRVNVNGKR